MKNPAPGIAHLDAAFAQLGARADVAYDLAMLELRAGHTTRAEELVRTVVVPLGSAELRRQRKARPRAREGDVEGQRRPRLGRRRARRDGPRGGAVEVTDPALRAQLEARLKEARAFQAHNAQIERYNAAIAKANAGKAAQARTDLSALRAEVTDEALKKSIDDVLRSSTRRSEGTASEGGAPGLAPRIALTAQGVATILCGRAGIAQG